MSTVASRMLPLVVRWTQQQENGSSGTLKVWRLDQPDGGHVSGQSVGRAVLPFLDKLSYALRPRLITLHALQGEIPYAYEKARTSGDMSARPGLVGVVVAAFPWRHEAVGAGVDVLQCCSAAVLQDWYGSTVSANNIPGQTVDVRLAIARGLATKAREGRGTWDARNATSG